MSTWWTCPDDETDLFAPRKPRNTQSQTVKAISGVHTVRFKNELERNITIKLGYANAKVRRDNRFVGQGFPFRRRGH